MFQLDIAALRAGKTTLADQTKSITLADLKSSATEMFDTLQALIADATDQAVLFVPKDSEAQSGDETGWTIGHVIAHVTATLEEGCAIATQLARSVEIADGLRLRYETPWESFQTAAQVRARLAESRRITLAFLDAWPDQPNLQQTCIRIPIFGPMNAISNCVLGIVHGQMHVQQITDTLNQASQHA